MHRLLSLGLSLALAATLAAEVQVGGTVAGFKLTEVNGKAVSFASLQGATTVVTFIATQCPISNDYNDRMNAVYKDYSAKGVQFVFINSNSSEPAAEVGEHARKANFAFPVYKDENNVVADQFGAQFTPEAYVIDKGGAVRYHGHIDDSRNTTRIQFQGLRAALDAVLAGKPVEKAETKAFGCTIKRVKK
jgi:peroxiredoxin